MLNSIDSLMPYYVLNQGQNGNSGINKSPGDRVSAGQTYAVEGSGDKKSAQLERALKRSGINECQTCKQRKYQDVSNDPGVSFKSPTHLSPESAASAVSAHESQHVAHENLKAASEDREVLTQYVQIYTSICPECGRTYVSGGKTTTVTAQKQSEIDETGWIMDQYI